MTLPNFTTDNLSAAFSHALDMAKAVGGTVTVVAPKADSKEVHVALGSVSAGTFDVPEGARIIATATPGGALL